MRKTLLTASGFRAIMGVVKVTIATFTHGEEKCHAKSLWLLPDLNQEAEH